MATVKSTLLGYSHISRTGFLAAKAYIWAMFLFLDTEVLTGPLGIGMKKFFPGMVGYSFVGLLCHHIVAICNLLNYFVVTTSPALFSNSY